MDSGGVRHNMEHLLKGITYCFYATITLTAKFVSSFATRRLLPTKTSLVVKFYQNPRRDLGVGGSAGLYEILRGRDI